MRDRSPPWWWSPRRCDSTTVTVLLADSMAVTLMGWPSRASKHIDSVWVKRTMKMILICVRRATPP